MRLQKIIEDIKVVKSIGDLSLDISSLVFDSREVVKDSLFIAIKGTLTDGHTYIDKAIAKGAVAIVCSVLPEQLQSKITYIVVADTQDALAFMAAAYYEHPSKTINLVGVTGTNGKTTIATLLYTLFTKAGYKVGLLSTVRIMVGTTKYDTSHTTPDSITINKYLRLMQDKGVAYCFMEVSSHGIAQKRTAALHFSGGVFTNLTHDHLDYHGTFSAYRDSKKHFFDNLPKTAFALVNTDDKNGRIMVQNTKASVHTYALKSMADYKAKILENRLSALVLQLENQEVWTRLIGAFNAYNLLAVYGVARLLGLAKIETLTLISQLESVDGRFSYFVSDTGVIAVVDYAHTPDALENVLKTLQEVRTGKETLFTVVGCGGDRDKTKRPIMGQIAAQYSDTVIFTSDNPRTEDPLAILKDITDGVTVELAKKTLTITDRKQALQTVCQFAKPNDIILVAGKGHETYQEVQGVRLDFDDLQILKNILNK